jgi:3-oxoacyl-(acyl-carrier-protein) synthase
MKRRRVKITGIGPVTPAGIGKDEFWKGILEPVSRIRPFHNMGEANGPIVAAYIDGFDFDAYFPKSKLPKGSARHTEFAIAGAVLALRDAGLDLSAARQVRTVVVTGSALFDFEGIGNSILGVERRGARAANGRLAYTSTSSSVATAILAALELQGDSTTLQTSCASGLDAIGAAAGMVAQGRADLAICGGTDTPLFRFPILEFRAAGLTPRSTEGAHRVARPFDLWRTTGVISEAACMLVLEPEDSPRPAYAYIGGYEFANDLDDQLCSGMIDCGRQAIAAANVRPNDVNCINAWGPGHRIIDVAESRAMEKLFGERIHDIACVSIKGAIGAPLSAAGPLQIAVAALALQQQVIPPTVNFEFPDPDCKLQLSSKARFVSHDTTIVNAHGAGGLNSCAVIQKC